MMCQRRYAPIRLSETFMNNVKHLDECDRVKWWQNPSVAFPRNHLGTLRGVRRGRWPAEVPAGHPSATHASNVQRWEATEKPCYHIDIVGNCNTFAWDKCTVLYQRLLPFVPHSACHLSSDTRPEVVAFTTPSSFVDIEKLLDNIRFNMSTLSETHSS